MMIDIAPLEDAIDRLEEGYVRYAKNIEDVQIRDGLIHRFERTYELSHKILKRYLVSVAASPTDYDQMAFADVIRDASRQGLLRSDWSAWRHYRDMRSKTSHAYAETIALDVAAGIPDFIIQVCFLRDQLQNRLS